MRPGGRGSGRASRWRARLSELLSRGSESLALQAPSRIDGDGIVSREEEALIAAVCDDPDDDVPRLVYADWLDEHGRPEYAELIRVTVRVERVSDDDTRRRSLVWRAR